MDQLIVRMLSYFELTCCLVSVICLIRSRSARKFLFLTGFLCVRIASSAICLPILYLAQRHLIEARTAYTFYFPVYWTSYGLEAILSLMVVYSVFRLAMAPLRGLQTLGMLVFRWAAAISVAVALSMAFGPHTSGRNFLVAMVTQLQQTSSILTLCLLLFVCFAIRPMGLSYRSRIFGVSFGLGLIAATDLVGSAWASYSATMYSVVNIINGIVICATLMTWSAYFAVPEPKRRIIVLPTTSPFLRWNQISIALGDEPGFVAVGGIPPEVFAPAEIEVMRRASVKMTSANNAALATASSSSTLHSLTA